MSQKPLDSDSHVFVDRHTAVPIAEFDVRATRSGGPGGQHVNTSSTRVEVTWDIRHSPSLSDAQRARLELKLASRLDSRGVLRVAASDTRSQLRNRNLAIERIAQMVREALVVPRVRRATKPTKASKERRLDSKRRQGDRKRDRRFRGDD